VQSKQFAPLNAARAAGCEALADVLLRVLLGLLILSGVAWANSPDHSQIVTITGATVDRPLIPGTIGTLKVTARVRSGWHIQSDRPSNEDFIPTRLTLSLPQGMTLENIQYPRALRIKLQFSDEELGVFGGELVFTATVKAGPAYHADTGAFPLGVKLEYQPCNDVECLRPATISANFTVLPARGLNSGASETSTLGASRQASVVQGEASSSLGLSDVFARGSYLLGFLLVFLGGLALNLTPCVYPLVGVTIAYFSNQSANTRRVAELAGCFVGGLVLTFSVLGVAAAWSGRIFGVWLSNPYVLAAIAILLLLLAAANFGWLNFRMPQWMTNWASSSRPGYLGAALMGAGMGIVASPCIGPFVVGLLLMVERQANLALGFAVFFTLALGLGAPYFVLALIAGSIRQLPRSGEWLQWIEHFFGFVLIGLALYFLDPLIPGRLMTRLLPYYAATAAIFLGFVSRSAPSAGLFSIIKRAVGLLGVLSLGILLLRPGRAPTLTFKPFDLAQLELAVAQHKPVLIDFSADWCIPCHEMEATTFTDPRVIREAQRFERFKADLTGQNQAADAGAARFDVKGVPTSVIINSRGQPVKKVVGYVGAREMLELLRRTN
jgi:thiol:disulfide interchange protein DsbD